MACPLELQIIINYIVFIYFFIIKIKVQVMGLPFEDEKCVRLMKEINDIFKFTP